MVEIMKEDLLYRQICKRDGVNFSKLIQSSPDTGRIGAKALYQLDPYQVAFLQHPDSDGVVVESPKTQKLIGAGLFSFKQGLFEGEFCDFALLHNLVVHPHFRLQGIATHINQHRLTSVFQRLGEGALVVASIQQGNKESLATACKWCTQFAGEVYSTLSKMRTSPPDPIQNIIIRQITNDDLGEVTEQQNQFYKNYNFYEYGTPKSLLDWLSQTPFDAPFRHYYLASDKQGNLLAGMALIEQYRLVAMQIERMPKIAQWLNNILAVVPPDGIMRQLMIKQIWYAPNQLRAAQYLWEWLRWEWQDRTNSMICFFDPRSPIRKIIRQPFWMPRSTFTFAIRSKYQMCNERLIYM